MSVYPPVRLPHHDSGGDQPRQLLDDIGRWVTCEPVRDLVALFGGALPDGDTADALEFLDRYSARHWDFRNGNERHLATEVAFAEERDTAILEAARALGMVGTVLPRLQDYTHVLILGGLVGSCLSRPRFAAELLSSAVSATEVTAVGGYRPFVDRDRETADAAGVTGCRFEVDAMEVGVERAFRPERRRAVESGGDPLLDPNRAWRVTSYESSAHEVIRVVAAPSSRPGERRADTHDTCRFWADQVVHLDREDTVLVITSSIFVPFQHCDALATMGLPYGCDVDTVGVDTATLAEPYLHKVNTSANYLQEIRSAIRSMRRLHHVATTLARSETLCRAR